MTKLEKIIYLIVHGLVFTGIYFILSAVEGYSIGLWLWRQALILGLSGVAMVSVFGYAVLHINTILDRRRKENERI